MKKSISRKIIENHLESGSLNIGDEVRIKIDQTLTQDATGTMAYLAFEALGIEKVKTEKSVSYIDHNTLQVGFENADDHRYLQSVAEKHGIYCSKAGNGICHQVHRERFAIPGKTLLGSDSHTPSSGGMGMLAIGAGGMSVAMAMAGDSFIIVMPKIVNINLTGKLRAGVGAKDIILELLRIFSVKGGVGKVFEYTGEGVKTLTIPERCTIANMGAELGLTTSVFPSDEKTYEFMKAQKREKDFIDLMPDEDAEYDEVVEINLTELEPLIAKPHMPDKVVTVKELEGLKVNQIFVGSCTNSSYLDLAKLAYILDGKIINKNVSLVVAPGSRQVFEMIARDGILQKLISSGARILECACGPCVGVGQAPSTDGVSLRTSNRNFFGRSGTKSAEVYLVSPEVAGASALAGVLVNPMDIENIDGILEIKESNNVIVDDRMIVTPPEDGVDIEVLRGPNIKPLPLRGELEETLMGKAIIKVVDNITTDDIMPAGTKIIGLRSNVPEISKYVFSRIDDKFYENAKREKGGFIVAGENYGQGSSREHAALAPMYLGIKAVIAKSFARIHKDNLINYGILPLIFKNKEDYDKIEKNHNLEIINVIESLDTGEYKVIDKKTNETYIMILEVTQRQKELLKAGGQLNYIKNK
ncbi:aconitate hydratase [uncultured Clostridium sp.]|uniref:aconitate hydratase n=1 Tax=uncultured Clostridium sp. TaxID=59620 RepID=UPI0026315A13|nr:aconitate hydratase [uncultured Clostridium sp.]